MHGPAQSNAHSDYSTSQLRVVYQAAKTTHAEGGERTQNLNSAGCLIH